jgi:hypothetical protein
MNAQIRWCSLNRKNLKIFGIITLVFKEPHKIRFTQNVSVNYELGVKVFFWYMMILATKIIYFSDCKVYLFWIMFPRSSERCLLLVINKVVVINK